MRSIDREVQTYAEALFSTAEPVSLDEVRARVIETPVEVQGRRVRPLVLAAVGAAAAFVLVAVAVVIGAVRTDDAPPATPPSPTTPVPSTTVAPPWAPGDPRFTVNGVRFYVPIEGLQYLRTDQPPGGNVEIVWFGPAGAVYPDLIVNVMRDVDAKAEIAAVERSITVYEDAARAVGDVLPPSHTVPVGTVDAVLYSDPLGTRLITWAPAADVVITLSTPATSRLTDDDLVRVARGAT